MSALPLLVAARVRLASVLADRPERGQATVEYVGILILVGAVMALVAGLAPDLGPKISKAISGAFDDAFSSVREGAKKG